MSTTSEVAKKGHDVLFIGKKLDVGRRKNKYGHIPN